MNILFLYRIYPNYGGVEVVTTVLANRFCQDGHRVSIVSFEQPIPELAEELEASIQLYKLDYPAFSRKNIRALRRMLKEQKVDILINQWGLPFYITALCRRAIGKSGIKLISVLHGAPDTSKMLIRAVDRVKNSSRWWERRKNACLLGLTHRVTRFSIRYCYRNSDSYVLLSPSFMTPLKQYAGLKNTSHLTAIGNPLTIPRPDKEAVLNFKEKQLLYVGRMDYENKRVNRIVEAWEALASDYPDWQLVLVGDGPYKSVLTDYVREHGVPRVTFCGFAKEPPVTFYKTASILLLTSDLEGFGLVVIEGMSYGVVPLVYGSYNAIYDIIRNGKSGFITPMPYQKENTLACLKQLMDNPVLLREMAVNAIQESSRFTIESISGQWYDLFHKCL